MHCSEFLARYSDYDDSLVPPAEAERFRAHMAACGSCARYDRVLRKGRMVARQLPAPAGSPEFGRRLELKLRAARRPRPVAPSGWAAAAAVVLALAGASLIVLRSAVPGAGVAPAAPVAEAGPAPASPSATRASGRVVALPPAAVEDPSDWTSGRVDRRVASTYSPLVIGPPAYRAPRSVILTSTTTSRRTLD